MHMLLLFDMYSLKNVIFFYVISVKKKKKIFVICLSVKLVR